MDEKNVVVANTEEITEVKEDSKRSGILRKVGSGIKNNWKTIAVGAGALMLGIMLGKRSSDEEVYDDSADDLVEVDENEPSSES